MNKVSIKEIEEFLNEDVFTPLGSNFSKQIIRRRNLKNNVVVIINSGEGRGNKKFLIKIAKEMVNYINKITNIESSYYIESGREPVITIEMSQYYNANDMANITTKLEKEFSKQYENLIETSWAV